MGSSSSDGWRGLRRGVKFLLGCVSFVVLLAIVLIGSLRLPAVRGAILDWAGSTLEESTGIHLTARDFALSLRTSEISLYDLELRADGGDSEPLLKVPVTDVELSWRSLLSDRPQIYSVLLQEPEIDLGAPMPQSVAVGESADDNPFPSLDIHHLEILEGLVRSGDTLEELDEWFDSWQADRVRLVGSLVDGIAQLEIRETQLAANSHRRPRVSANLTAQLSIDDGGQFAVEILELSGDHIGLTLEGRGRLDPNAPLEASIDLHTDLAGLVPDLTTSGQLDVTGNITFTAAPEAVLIGNVQVSGHDFPAELLEPLFSNSNLGGLHLEETQLDITANLKTRIAIAELTNEPANDFLVGEAQVTWRRQDEPLVTASCHLWEGQEPREDQGISASFNIHILPTADGSRKVDGNLFLPGWTALDEIALGEVKIRFQHENLRSLGDQLGWSPDVFGGFQPAGGISLTGQVDGPIATPDIELNGDWRLNDRSLIELAVSTSTTSDLAFQGALLPDSPGARTIEGGWAFSGFKNLREGSFDNVKALIEVPDLESALVDVEELAQAFVPDADRRQVLLATLSPEIRKRLTGSLQADLTAQGPLKSPTIELAGTWVPPDSEKVPADSERVPADSERVPADSEKVPADSEYLSVKGSFSEDLLTISELSGALRGLVPGEEVLKFGVQGEMRLEKPIQQANLTLQIFDPIADIHQLDLNARLQGGILTLEGSAPSIPGRIEANIPLGVLAEALPDQENLVNLPLVFAPGSLEIEISELELGRTSEILFYLTGTEFQNLGIAGVLDALVTMNPTDPLASVGTLEVAALQVSYGDVQIVSDRDLRVNLEEGHIALEPVRLRAIGPRAEAPLEVALAADLDPEWQLEDGFKALVDNLVADLEGTIDSSLLTPFLAGGVATGPISIAASARGSLSDLQAEVRLEGPEASLVLPGRYRTRISEPELEVVADSSGAELRLGRMRLNRGEVALSGSLGEDKTLRLATQLAGVRYRLDHGLTVVVDGNLNLTWPQEGQRRLSGMIDLERGSLRRNLQLEQELIRMLNPSDLAGTGSALLQSVDLNLDLVTREGVRIKNNLADLRADWDLIRVRGTLAEPTITGRIDVDPGGLLTAYGQTVRIDQGALIFSGVPGEPPRMDFETTSSAEDPRLRNQWNSAWSTGPDRMGPGGGFWDRYDPQGSSGFQAEDFTNTMTSYFQNRFLQSISGGAPRVELSVQPLPLMGETDTTARVTMSYHLTPQISFVLSQNPREAEGRTDILNLHNFALAPSLQGQFFRNDQGNHGVTVQQTLEFGGGRKAEDAMPRLRAIDLTAPKEVRKRTVRRATGLRKGQPVAEGADFDIEIDLLDALARRGYPAADVAVDIMPAPRNRVTVAITAEPGIRVDFEFTGDQPGRRARQDIIALYQPTGLRESPALETIRRDTIRALRARGFLDPQVEVTTEDKDPGNPASARIIRVHGEGGREVNPQTLQFPSLPDDVQGTLVVLFSSRLSRVELATGEMVADDLLRQSMRTMGYTHVQILSRDLSSDGSTLVVEVEPGPRRHLATVQILGANEEVRAALDGIRLSEPGDPLRSGQISRTTFLMEDHLREKGFANASVQSRVEPAKSDEDGEVDVFFDVEMGREHRVGELSTEGLANSSPQWVERISKLEKGELLTDSSLTLARRRLAQTGVFQRIAIRREEPAEPEATSVLTPITFELEEHPRYRVTYGLRGESTREAGVVADVSDLNFLGRGQTLGLRLIYATLERNARLYWSIPRIRQSNKNLEFFLEARREESVSGLDENEDPVSVIASIREAWAQVTFPWGRRSVHRFYTVYKRSVTEDPEKPDDPADTVVSPFSGWQVSYDTGERSFFETSTDKITLFLGSDLSFASESLGSDYTGYGLFGQIKPQIPLVKMGNSALVWVHNYRVGLKESRGGVDLPFFDRLFAGGEFSVRGYPTNSLGPQNEEGIPLGGEALFVTNQELRFPLWTLLSGVAFFDAGNVWATVDDVESSLFKSIGLGLRADSPIGPLRLDFAYPLDRREGDPEYKVYFGLGQTF